MSQSVIPPGYNLGASEMFAFTEQGVSMLSSVLRSPVAMQMSIQIIRAFVAMRRFISANAGMFQRIESLERHQLETDQKIDRVLDRLNCYYYRHYYRGIKGLSSLIGLKCLMKDIEMIFATVLGFKVQFAGERF